MSLIEYEGPCTVCGQRVTWKPSSDHGGRSGRPPYIFRHDGMLETIAGSPSINLEDISSRLHEENRDH